MKKQSLILSMLVCLILCLHLSTHSQTLNDDESDIIICPVNAAFTRYPSVNSVNTTQSSFSPSATIACGNFRVYYEDLQLQTGEGFDDPALGAFRRNTLCAVLNYVQSVLHVSVTVDLHVEQSLTPIANPANTSNYRWLALAGPNYKTGTYGSVPGYFGGNLYDHITTGLDPDPTDYDAHVTFNFHQIWSNTTPSYPAPLSYWDDYLNTTPSCRADLFSVSLHEIGHCLGFISGIGDDGSANHYITNLSTNPNSFTKLDQNFFWYGDARIPGSFTGNKLVNGTTTPILNPSFISTPNFLANYTSTLSANSVWMTNSGAPNNYKAYDGYWYMNVGQMSVWNLARGSFLSHLDRADMAVYRGGQHSPGFQPKYVMGPSILPNEQVRSWTIQEIRMFKTLGYNLNPTFASSTSLSTNNTISNSALLLNSPPCRTNTVSLVRFPLTSNADYINALCDPENKPVDLTLINNNIPGFAIATNTVIDTHTLPNIGDLNGQQVGVFPNSIYGVRGVTTGGNNHNSIVLTNSHTIVYTPPPGFYGRAEFGFNLWDGLEKGGVKVITIEVLPPTTAFTLTPGSELVINGSFEDATEVKTVANPTVAISTRINGHVTQLNYATHESGGHPYLCLYYGGGYYNRGVVKKESYRYCYNLTSTILPSMNPEGYGSEYTSCQAQPYNTFVANVLPVNTGTANNECYVAIKGDYQIFGASTPAMVSTLMNPLKTCGYYRMEFDVAQDQAYPIGFLMKCNLLAATNLTNSSAGISYTTLQSIPLDYTVSTVITNTTYNWQHVAVDFVYCGAPTKTVLIEVPLQSNLSLLPYSFGIDNISIKEKTTPPPPLIVTATNSSTLFCSGSTATLTGHAFNSSCQPQFTWQPMGTLSNTVVVTPPNPNTTYTLLANDGCRTGSAIVTAAPLPSGSFTAPSICIGQVSAFSLESLLPASIPTPGVFSGPAIVVGAGSNHYIDLTAAGPGAPFAQGNNIYTYTHILANGCSQSYTCNISFIATPSIVASASPPCISLGQTSTLSINPGPGIYSWQPGNLSGLTVTVSPNLTTTYTITGVNGMCSSSQTLGLTVFSPVSFTNLPAGVCTGSQIYYLENFFVPGVPIGGTWSAPGLVLNSVNTFWNQVFVPVGTTPGIYSISYQYSNTACNINTSGQFTINVLMTPTVSSNAPLSRCTNIPGYSATLIATSTSSLPMTYTWSPSGTISPSIVVSPTTSSVYTVTGTDGTCTSTPALAEVSTNSLCCGSNTTATTFQYLNMSTLGSATLSGLYAINQNMTINGNVSLDGEYYIAPNVAITIANGGYLNTKATYTNPDGTRSAKVHMLSCYDMWNGITVNNGGRVELEAKDLIEDAKVAISSNSSTNTTTNPVLFDISLNGVAFNRNNIGVSIKNYTQTANSASPFEIINCAFTCRTLTFTSYQNITNSNQLVWPDAGNLMGQSNFTNSMAPPSNLMGFSPANLKSPMSSDISAAGVWVENSGITSGPTNASPVYYGIIVGDRTYTGVGMNLFDNLVTGIYGLNSNVNSYNNMFQNSRNSLMLNGAGIRAINNNSNPLNYNTCLNLVTPSNPTLNINRFYDCHRGIETNNYFQLNVQYSEFRSTQSKLVNSIIAQQGIFIISNRFKNYQINYNKFLNLKSGVCLFANSGLYNLTGSFGNGQVWGSVNIKYNYFSPVANPTVAVGNNYMNDAVIVENLLYTKGTPPLLGAGFYTVTPFNGLWVQHNTIDQVYRGVYAVNFSNSLFGKFTANNSILLKQDHIATNPQWGVKYTNNYAGVVNTNTITGFTTSTATPLSGVAFSLNTNGSIQCNKTFTLPVGSAFGGVNPSTVWRTNTMQNNSRGMQLSSNGIIGQQGTSTVPSDNYWQGTTWVGLNKNLYAASSTPTLSKIYKRTLNGYDPLNPGGNPTSFNSLSLLNSNNGAAYPPCVPVSKQLGGNNPIKTGLYNSLISGNGSYINNVLETDEINRMLMYRDLDQDSAFRVSDNTQVSFYANEQTSDIGKLTQIEQFLSEGDFTSANGLMTNYTPNTNIQANYKRFYELYVAYTSNGVLNASETADLDVLAHKCPFIDGAIVFSARVLFDLIFNNFTPYNDDDCDAPAAREGERRNSNISQPLSIQKESSELNYQLFPNPAIDELNIYGVNETEKITVFINDVNNKLLLQQNLFIADYKASLKFNLLNGVYFVTLVNQNNTHFVKKLVISK